MSKHALKYKQVIPLFNRVLVKKPEPIVFTEGGIMLPEGTKPKLHKATVVSVGPGETKDNGAVVPVKVKPGDEVVLSSFEGVKIELENDETYYLYRENEILATLKK
ncbi:10 kDa heat shock protein, mitochondrial-like [Diorhabda carinulata]|uniref:10 kDa heat shock protein, mitochondrial-like n=1 Tax=Diorhabda carinulata TaxID=1163345 RepID=UPI0025A0A7C5|nr:10 kDa heat shock protein, mitochondrial-like [Diorhabda carinulata]